ncbi:TetR/AcrR family transcriptional regulator [Lactiplantibacillus daowaiensis]|uniref:TetR/AcrR family transcriptional regulator n=1 Tax=Lactiplantibacillus daowaiensis TaxID=2559918 RepID=A0ABW1S236_9LACO|nr:TetR/AcrR family transcriptional regulator [Lactiplantibacillus daowaiensis]
MSFSTIKIKQAFIACLNRESFERLTVSELVKLAEINRGTFYQHYTDKYDLLAQYEDQISHRLQSVFSRYFQATMTNQTNQATVAIYPVVTQTVQLLQSEAALLRALLGPNGDPRFEYRLKRQVKQAVQQRLTTLKGQPTLSTALPADFAWELVIAELFDIVKFWLFQSHPVAPADLATIIMKTRYLSPYQLLGLSEDQKTSD